MKTHQTYVLDTGSWPRDRVVDACRRLLDVIRPDAAKFETDVPITDALWPPEVAAAADRLRAAAVRSGRVEAGGYAQTGVLGAGEESWNDFVIFSPWAYDAGVWDADGHLLVWLADEANDISTELSAQQHEAVVAELGATTVVPLAEWKRTRKARSRRQ